MATVVELLARLRADSSQFTSEMERAGQATEKFQSSADQTAVGLNNLGGVFKKLAGGAIAMYIGKLGMESVAAAQAASVGQDRLARLLATTGGATADQIKILQAHADALERTTVVTGTNITMVQSQLATFDLHGSTIAQLTPAILDYVVAEKGAAATADDYRQMTNGLAQALNGQFASLTAVGFVLDAETKAKIKSGTESERAIAITEVLNSTYKDFAKGASGSVAAQVALGKQIDKLKEKFGQALLPVIQSVMGFMSESLVPALEKALVAFKGFVKVLGAVAGFIKKNEIVFAMLATAIITYIALTKAARISTLLFGKAMGLVKKAQQSYAAWTYVTTGATTGFAGAMNLLKTAFMTNPIGIIVTALIAVAVGFKMAWDRSETFRKVVIGVAKGVLKGIGFIIRVVGFVAEAFLNLILGPLKLFLKVLGFINPGAKAAYEGLSGMTNKVGQFFDDAAKKVEGYGDTLDKYAKITKKTKDTADNNVDLSGLGDAGGDARIDEKTVKAAAAAAKKLAEMKRALQKAVVEYNDYLAKDFTNSFNNGAESARGAVMGALDKLESVFEAKGKMLSGGALANLRKAFDKVNADVRVSMEKYAKVAQEIEDVNTKLEEANKELEKSIEDRASAMKRFGDLLRTPFGEQSAIDKAMRDGEATVDSIISMYDDLVDAIDLRFSGMESGAKSLIVDYLTDQTTALITLAKSRSKAVDALKESEKDLEEVLETQSAFQKKLASGVKDFAKALINLSDSDTKAVLSVTRTASGLVISQVKKATTGVDAITGQLKTRLAEVVSFGKNIEKLLAAGLSREYIQQLLEAGPDAASATAALLTTASADQIKQINSLYDQINTQADSFGTEMSKTFYGNSVAMAQAFVAGAKAEVENINSQMTAIVTGIKTIMGVLGNTGLTSSQALIDGLIAGFGEVNKALVGVAAKGVNDSVTKALESLKTVGTALATDLAQGMFDKLTAEKVRLVALATDIATSIANAMAGAAAGIGVIVDGATGDMAELNKQIAATKAAQDKLTAGGGGGGVDKGGKDDKSIPVKTNSPVYGGTYADMYKAGGNPNLKQPITLSKVVGTTATVKMPPIVLKAPTPVVKPPTPTVKQPATPYISSSMFAAKPNVTVNIKTDKVVPTVTSTTIAKAIGLPVITARRG